MRPLVTVLLALLFASSARADGGPLTGIQGGAGAGDLAGRVNYVAVGTAGRTVLERVERTTGTVTAWRSLRGPWTTPIVGLDRSATGLSADGGSLVLERSTRRYPPRRSRFALIDPGRMRVRSRFSLPGFWLVDAISPAGRWLYFTHYARSRTFLDYEVRAYDLRRRRLVPGAIVDPREPDEQMTGTGITRASSPDGRWAYTLYVRPQGEPFVHALDTVARRAACVDLDALALAELDQVRLGLAGGTLYVTTGAGPQALIDTRTFAVTEPPVSGVRHLLATAMTFAL